MGVTYPRWLAVWFSHVVPYGSFLRKCFYHGSKPHYCYCTIQSPPSVFLCTQKNIQLACSWKLIIHIPGIFWLCDYVTPVQRPLRLPSHNQMVTPIDAHPQHRLCHFSNTPVQWLHTLKNSTYMHNKDRACVYSMYMNSRFPNTSEAYNHAQSHLASLYALRLGHWINRGMYKGLYMHKISLTNHSTAQTFGRFRSVSLSASPASLWFHSPFVKYHSYLFGNVGYCYEPRRVYRPTKSIQTSLFEILQESM